MRPITSKLRLPLKRPKKGTEAGGARFSPLPPLRENPGKLGGWVYVPPGLTGPAPLVVVLHGCTQDAAGYDRGSGWSTLAERHGFILLFPEQSRANNQMLCFNWFTANDSQRGMGEAASIKAMVDAVKKAHAVDAERVFVTGLSAGGAMAAVMLAAYPEVFSAGAIIAGVPYGCASGVSEAFDCMGGRARSDAQELGRAVRRASPHKGPWPRVQVWQGTADHTVVPSNADAVVLQWADLHGLDPALARADQADGHMRRTWVNGSGQTVIEQYTVSGMGHGVPLDPRGDGALGEAGAHMLDVGLDSTARIAAFFGIAPEAAAKAKAEKNVRSSAVPRRRSEAASGPQAVIEKALRTAGLLR
jgi:poly(hydroxyalkanoate) depolymerase family esterase